MTCSDSFLCCGCCVAAMASPLRRVAARAREPTKLLSFASATTSIPQVAERYATFEKPLGKKVAAGDATLVRSKTPGLLRHRHHLPWPCLTTVE